MAGPLMPDPPEMVGVVVDGLDPWPIRAIALDISEDAQSFRWRFLQPLPKYMQIAATMSLMKACFELLGEYAVEDTAVPWSEFLNRRKAN